LSSIVTDRNDHDFLVLYEFASYLELWQVAISHGYKNRARPHAWCGVPLSIAVIAQTTDNMASEQNGTLPASQKKWILSGTKRGMDEWKLSEGPIPQVTSRGVLVRMVAAALNYREILIPDVSDEAAV
jgi:hypothetical protein